MLTGKQVYDIINEMAPFDTAEGFDNSGFLLGDQKQEVTGIMAAVDLTPEVLNVAKENGCSLIFTHHPMLFHARKNLDLADPESRLLAQMLREGMSLLSAHTNLDQAKGGISDTLADILSLSDVTSLSPYTRLGKLEHPMRAGELRDYCAEQLNAPVRLYGAPETPLTSLAVAGGAYSEGYTEALAAGCTAYLTGEVSHHDAVTAIQSGMVLLEGGHYATELPGIQQAAAALQNALDALQLDVHVICPVCLPYEGAMGRR